MRTLPNSTLAYLLQSLIPYTEANLKLSFKPNLFFNDLEKIACQKRQTIRNAYYKAVKDGLVTIDDQKIPRLTDKGKAKLSLYHPKKLKNAQLMMIFDIPEAERPQRQRLRAILKEFRFVQVQKSVWVSQYDFKHYLSLELKHESLEQHVLLYEAAHLKI